MAAHPTTLLTADEYLTIERAAEYKSEFHNGRMYAMAGGGAPHSLIGGNFNHAVRIALEGKPCYVFTSDMRLFIARKGLYTYPDVSIVCGKPAYAGNSDDLLTNPIVIVEVLSPSTEAYDRGQKFSFYDALPSLAEYVLVSQRMPRVEKYLRAAASTWTYTAIEGLDQTLTLESVGCQIPLAAIYRLIDFSAAPDLR